MRVVRAATGARRRRLLHLLALIAVSLPLAALAPSPADAPVPVSAERARPPVRAATVIDGPPRSHLRPDASVAERSEVVLPDEALRPEEFLAERSGTRTLPDEAVWDALARCEADGRWDAVRIIGGRIVNAGGLQFATMTWDAYRPEGAPALASDATREQQIAAAERVLARQGWDAWPTCARRLGLR